MRDKSRTLIFLVSPSKGAKFSRRVLAGIHYKGPLLAHSGHSNSDFISLNESISIIFGAVLTINSAV